MDAVSRRRLFLVIDSFRGLGVAAVGWLLGLYAGSTVLTSLYAGSTVLTSLYAASGRSILLVAQGHTAYHATSATAATSGPPAALASTAVMVAAVVIAVDSLRHPTPRRRPLAGTPGPFDPDRTRSRHATLEA